MLAELVLGAPQQGPARLDPAAVRQALLAAGVVSGITPPGVLEATGTGSELRAVVACGNAPVPGEDSRFELLVSETRDRSPVVDADGLVDFRELGAIPLVVAGQALMRRHPPVPGVDGLTVRGEVVAAAAGQELPFDLPLPGVRISAASPDVLEAEVNGQPVREGNGVRIEQVLRVSRVDVASGNLEFDGTVQVDGDVQSGMRLSATGDIVILGGVEGGEVSAGGDVRVAGGVIAHGIIRAGGAVSARFVEAAKVRAGTSIMIEDNALQSELEAMNAIRVGARSARRGRLAGGVARAMLLIQAPWVGAEAGALTRIELGVNPDLDERYAEVLRRIEEHKAGEAKLQSLIKHLSRQKDNPALLQRAQVSWQHSVRTWAKLLPQRDALELERARAASARIEIDAGLDGAVDLVIATRSARLRQALGAGTLALDGERIVFHARAHALPTKDA
ncbi:MAG: DUF342 domain-containing protein [Pseudomonadota bacterium]|nr:DUF342 domain-containing protein [Pseudomonadota bacterium]